MTEIRLIRGDGRVETYRLVGGDAHPTRRDAPPRSRIAYAAAHVVADPLADNAPGAPARLDWDATLAYRRHLWRLGLGVAEAMDTAQRGMGLDWPATRELIQRSCAEAAAVGGRIVCGAATDQLEPGAEVGLDRIVDAYVEQIATIVEAGGTPVVMGSRHLAAVAQGPDDYAKVYDAVLSQVREPVLLHWLGAVFDPVLAGYWGSDDLDEAAAVCLDVIARNADRIAGIKLSLLDADREVALRRRLPAGVRMFTGDDFHYPELILGDEHGHSDALLGVFDAIAPAAAAALAALDEGDRRRYAEILDPTVPLARHLFAAPTSSYKTGIVFLAYLAGHQDHFVMVGGLQSGRSLPHLGELFVLADRAGLLPDPDLAVTRMRRVLALAGVEG